MIAAIPTGIFREVGAEIEDVRIPEMERVGK